MELPTTAITLYSEMAVERAIDPLIRGWDVGRSYAKKLDELLDALFALVREHEPQNETCPMCGGGLVKAKGDAPRSEGRPQGRGGWLSTSLATGMGVGAIAGALAAVGLQHLFKVRRRSRSERLIDLLRAQPGRSIGDLTTDVYETDTPSNRNKVRALLAQLVRLGKLRKVGPGCWEAVEEDALGDEEEGEEPET